MTLFVALAALMVLLAAAAIATPLLRPHPGGAAPASSAAVLSVAVLLLGGAGLYHTWSNWSWSAPPVADTPQGMVARLARRLEKEPGDAQGWLMLGRSYAVLEELPLALRAYERADRLAAGKSVEALLGIAETLTLQNESEIDGRAGRLFEQALALEPDSGKALFFSAVAASRRGELPLARERFQRLLALDPPANIRPMLEQQIKAIDDRLAAGPAGVAAGASAAAPGATTPPAGTAEAVVKVSIRLSPKLPAQSGDAPLFVLVRDGETPGPPLAAKRLPSTFPQSVELTPRDSMIAGRSFRSGQTVRVVARIARSGTPVAQSGDPFGELDYTVGTDGVREIVIDRLAP